MKGEERSELFPVSWVLGEKGRHNGILFLFEWEIREFSLEMGN